MLKIQAFHGSRNLGAFYFTADEMADLVSARWAELDIVWTIVAYMPGKG